MHNPDEVKSVYDFIKQTPEGALKKMFVSGDFTEAHLRLLIKMAKGGAEADFIDAFTKEDMGKMRLSPKEAPLKDAFWAICKKKLTSLGLLPVEKAA